MLVATMNSIMIPKYMIDSSNKLMNFSMDQDNTYVHPCMVIDEKIGVSLLPYILTD